MTAAQGASREVAITKVQATEGPSELRLDRLTGEVGWLLITAGVVGVIMPGIPGTPFLIVGVLVVTPGGTKLLSRWSGKKAPRVVSSGMKQISRFLDDLERRYPRDPQRTGSSSMWSDGD